jgi:hypothetical protein
MEALILVATSGGPTDVRAHWRREGVKTVT